MVLVLLLRIRRRFASFLCHADVDDDVDANEKKAGLFFV